MQETKDFLLVHDEDAHGNRYHSFRLLADIANLSVRELIQSRINSEVERFNTQRPVCFFTLVQPENAETTARGYRLQVHRDIDPVAQLDAALAGFEKKSFLVHANGRDYQKLDEQIPLQAGDEITFVKFMEVIGG